MTRDIAKGLYINGRSHALAADRLYRAAADDGLERNPNDPEFFAFNGPYSLSIHYLVSLGFELMLKAAYVAAGGPSDEAILRAIGHDLVKALDLGSVDKGDSQTGQYLIQGGFWGGCRDAWFDERRGVGVSCAIRD